MLRVALVLTTLLLASAASARADYTELSHTYSYVYPLAVNSSGTVLAMGSKDYNNPNNTVVPVTWNGSYTELIGTPADAPRFVAYDLNDQGRVAGGSVYPSNPDSRCTYWQSQIFRGLVWSGSGVLTELGGLPHTADTRPCVWTPETETYAINNAGTVLGTSEGWAVTAAAGSSEVAKIPAGCPGSPYGPQPLAISDAGTVVYNCNSGTGGAHTVSSSGVITDLPSGFAPVSRAITPSGVVLGRLWTTTNLPAKVDGANAVTALQPLPGDTSATAEAIADDGTVVGESTGAGGTRATLWHPDGTAVDLNEQAPGASGRLVSATAISSDGAYIVGRVDAGGGQTDAPVYRLGAGRNALDVDITAATPDGRTLDSGGLTEQEAFDVRVTLRNTSTTETIKDLNYAGGGAPLSIDARSSARIGTLSAPGGQPPASLAPGETKSFDYRLTAGTDGVAAALVRVTGRSAGGTPQEARGSLKITVTQAGRLNAALAQYARLHGMDTMLLGVARKFYKGWDRRGAQMQAALRRVLSPAERKRWFGTASRNVVDQLDLARALVMGRAPSATAAQFPNKGFSGYTAEELQDEYNRAFKAELGKGVDKYVKRWSDLGAGARDQVRMAYGESALALNYIMNTASQDQRQEAEAMVLAFSDGVVEDTTSYANWTRNEVSNLLNDGASLITAFDQTDKGADDLVDGMTQPFVKRAEARDKIARYADDEPIKFMRESAKLDARDTTTAAEAVADTMIGGAATKLVTSSGRIVQATRKGAALLNFAKATEVVDESGKLAKGVHAVKDTKNSLGVGLSGTEASGLLQEGEAAMKNLDGATLVQSSDYGNVYRLPNVGGVPEVTLDAKAQILKGVEDDYARTFGRPIELAEVLKPSTELRKPGSVAKLELTGQKTGKAAMVDAGMPADALGEAVYWKPKVRPQEIPGFRNLSKERQAAAIKEYENALKAVDEWDDPKFNSKTYKLQRVIGREGTVALDDRPWPGGLQRFINAEFELVRVPGRYADAYLIRVKRYEIVVKDTLRGGRVVNTKTVVNSARALAQGVDADAVAVMKVVGRDAAGKPILASMSASERSFTMSRYIDRNVRARASGLVTDLAEHGATLVMDDADALHAGFLQPKFGVPFMPDEVGIPFLKRIAQFVAPRGVSADEMFNKMLAAVKAEGGFGQHAVILTRDTRYLGEVPVSAW
jgi:uncharacterized membrane protein